MSALNWDSPKLIEKAISNLEAITQTLIVVETIELLEEALK